MGENANVVGDERDLCSNVGKSGCLAFSLPNVAGHEFRRRPGEVALDTAKRGEALAHLRDQMSPVPINGGGGTSSTGAGAIV